LNKIHFLLTPDSFASRYLRRYVTQNNSFLGIVVGTFSELLEQVRSAYLLKRPESNWQDKLNQVAARIPDAFWTRSLALYPAETSKSIVKVLTDLIEGSFPSHIKIPAQWDAFPTLTQRHFEQLNQLHQEMNYSLPSHFETAADILNHQKKVPVTFCVYSDSNYVELKPWQSLVVNKINTDGGTKDDTISALYDLAIKTFHGKQVQAIQHCADNLFFQDASTIDLDGSLQWVAARDYLEEAEVVANQVKTLVDDDEVVPSDIALLLPSDQRYAFAVKETFSRVGIPLSGLTWDSSQRDLGREVLFHYFMVVKKPVSIIAWAALLTSPLMPWSAETGHDLAQRIVNRNFDLKKMPVQGEDELQMLECLDKDLQRAEPGQLLIEMELFKNLLSFDDDLANEHQRFEDVFLQCRVILQETQQIDWDLLRRLTTPEAMKAPIADPVTQGGVAVFLEDSCPWREVKHLFVLGFGEGHYPQTPGYSSIFTDRDLQMINLHAGSKIEVPQQIVDRSRRRFKLQLASATKTINFSFSRMSPQGKSQQPSSTLPFIAALFSDINDTDDLILELDHQADRQKINWLVEIDPVVPVSPEDFEVSDLDLEIDLLKLHTQKDGSMRPQSPSSLANLMTSPLAWLFNWVGLRPLEWSPETMDPATKGTLAHEVFEFLFTPDAPLPTPDEIREKVPKLLHKAIVHVVPFLLATEWRVERNHLESDIVEAALQWQNHLKATGMQVIGNEIKLYGELDGVPLKGFADVFLSLPDGRIIIGDYKKSRSAKRIKQMESGLDSQASLYRIMLEKGRISTKQQVLLPDNLSASNIGVLYYTLNDQIIMTDTHDWLTPDPDIKEMGSDIASEAMARLRVRFEEVRKGKVLLNFAADEKIWDDLGVKLYCLDNSPLLRMYMHTEEVSS